MRHGVPEQLVDLARSENHPDHTVCSAYRQECILMVKPDAMTSKIVIPVGCVLSTSDEVSHRRGLQDNSLLA